MKWSTPLVTSSIGTRAGALQWTPSDDLLNTMSFAAQRLRKRQSSHATYTVPAPSTSALGSGLVRRLPATPWKRAAEMGTAFVHDAPPSFERNDEILPVVASKGTTTVPSGCTTGWPPRPLSRAAVWIGTL